MTGMTLPHVDPVGWAVGLIALSTAGGLIYRYVYRPLRGAHRKIMQGMDTLLGYGAVVDPATGRVIQADTPPLANRVYNLEEALAKIATAVETFANTHKDVVQLQERWDERDKAGLKIIEDWTAWREAHEKEAAARERRLAEWDQWRSEQTLLGAIVRENLDLPTRESEDPPPPAGR